MIKPARDITFLFQSFMHRQDGIEIAQRIAANNLDSLTRRLTTKQNFKYIIISGGSGSGKSRAANEIGNILRNAAGKKQVGFAGKILCF